MKDLWQDFDQMEAKALFALGWFALLLVDKRWFQYFCKLSEKIGSLGWDCANCDRIYKLMKHMNFSFSCTYVTFKDFTPNLRNFKPGVFAIYNEAHLYFYCHNNNGNRCSGRDLSPYYRATLRGTKRHRQGIDIFLRCRFLWGESHQWTRIAWKIPGYYFLSRQYLQCDMWI